MTKQIAIAVFPRLTALDGIGPYEVLQRLPGYEVVFVGAERGEVRTENGMLGITADATFDDVPHPDVVVFPGGVGTRTVMHDEQALDWVRTAHETSTYTTSVCTGSIVLGAAGLLDGRHCTTHHDVQDELALRHPRAVVVRDVLFTTDDRVITSAGIASGIDLALHLVATRHGPAVAAQVARDMVVYARRNGHEPQSSAMLRHRSHLDDTVHRAQDLIDARFDQPLPLPTLASAVGVSERTLTRLFSRATGLTPLRYQQTLRLERAQHFISHGATIDAAARSVGFEDPRMLRRLRARTA